MFDDVMNSLHSLQGRCNSLQNLLLLIVKHAFWCVMSDMIVLDSPRLSLSFECIGAHCTSERLEGPVISIFQLQF